MSDAPKAVFLSYAREDTDAARGIADALRGFGVEVWFDQSELRGGDQWDAKIKKQIRECALFLPLVSAQTQARSEGYFRREWKLAVERTHDMAAGRAFVVPVVIDATTEAEAEVPEEFMRFQWTRLTDGAPTPEFVAQVKRLLLAPRKPTLKPDLPRPPTLPPMLKQAALERAAAAAVAETKKSGVPGWIWGALAAVILLAGAAGAYLYLRPPAPAAPPPAAPVAAQPPAPASAPSPAPPAGRSVAVLPFANFSLEKDNEFFADGLQDEVITALAKIHDLKVISRTSVMAYRNPEGRNLRKIAADLGVTAILEGSVQRAGNQIHLNVQLIDAGTDDHLWANTYTKELTDIFVLEGTLAREIAGALKANLTDGERDLIARRPTQNPEAYELYLRALIMDQNLAIFNKRADYEATLGLYEQAAAKDPSFVLPHVRASILHGTMYWFAAIDATPERKAKALAELEAARRLAPGAPETRMAEGTYEYTCNNDWNRALEHFLAAAVDLPNDALLHFHLGLTYRRLGRLTDALQQFEQSVALNPGDNNTDTTLVETNYSLRRFPRVLELCERYLRLFPDDVKLQRFRVFARYESDGDRSAFLRDLHTLPAAKDPITSRSMAYQDALVAGDLAGAEQILVDAHQDRVLNLDGSILDPMALHRAMLACLRDRPEEARRWADEAITAYHQGHWVYRQEPWVQLGLARADVYAGRVEEGLRAGRAAMSAELERDGFSSLAMRFEYGRMLILAHRPEDALAELRLMAASPAVVVSRNVIREDPIWSRLKGDPRFEEILRSFQPL